MRAKPKHLRRAIMLLCLAGALAAVCLGVTSWITPPLAAKLATLQNDNERLARQIRQWKQNAMEADSLRAQISDEQIKALLKPVKPNAWPAIIEALAASSHLTHNKIDYMNASPWDGGADFSGIQGISRASLTIEADAPSDVEIYSFLAALWQLNARIEIETLSITRLTDAPPAALNVHLSLRANWYSNDPEGVVQ